MMELNYEDFWAEIEAQLRPAEAIILATSADSRVTTRTVCPLLDGTDILISTGGRSLKIQQIKANPNVALVLGGINIEAFATLYGHPGTHPTFPAAYAEKYPQLGAIYKSEPEDVLIVARPKRITLYKYTGKACEDVLDMEAKKAFRIEL